MIAGHFGLAAAVKSYARQAPLWALMLATVWLDLIFVPLFLMGIETIQQVPGTQGGYGQGIIHADYTHSVIGALALAAIFGALAAIWWGRRTGLVLAAVLLTLVAGSAGASRGHADTPGKRGKSAATRLRSVASASGGHVSGVIARPRRSMALLASRASNGILCPFTP